MMDRVVERLRGRSQIIGWQVKGRWILTTGLHIICIAELYALITKNRLFTRQCEIADITNHAAVQQHSGETSSQHHGVAVASEITKPRRGVQWTRFSRPVAKMACLLMENRSPVPFHHANVGGSEVRDCVHTIRDINPTTKRAS